MCCAKHRHRLHKLPAHGMSYSASWQTSRQTNPPSPAAPPNRTRNGKERRGDERRRTASSGSWSKDGAITRRVTTKKRGGEGVGAWSSPLIRRADESGRDRGFAGRPALAAPLPPRPDGERGEERERRGGSDTGMGWCAVRVWTSPRSGGVRCR